MLALTTAHLLLTALCSALGMLAFMLWRADRHHRAHIQEREQLGAQLTAREAVARAAYQASPSAILVLDRAGCVLHGSECAFHLLGQPSRVLLGQRLGEALGSPQLARAIQDCLGGTTQEVELELVVAQTPLACRVHLQPLLDLGISLWLEDLRRIRQLEELRRDFVANVSHELKTPLAAIIGFVETMLDDQDMDAATRQRFLTKVASQSERLSRLVADLLTLSALDENQVPERLPRLRLDAVVRETLREFMPMAAQRQVQLLSTTLDEVCVAADQEALRQVIGNLLDNAIKYTPAEGQVVVTVRRETTTVCLAVQDNGIGLSPEHQERIFERFYRVDRARSRDLGGTGLGLSIVKNQVTKLGGSVGVQSQLGQGSQFWVRLPIAAPGE